MCKKLIYSFSFVLVLSMAGRGWPGVSKPNPPDGAVLDDTWVNLSWQPGAKAASFDVYLGDSFDSVNDGTGGTFRGNQTLAYFVAGFPGYPYPDGLVPGTTYYWRIDELQTDGTAVHKGSVWSFSIPAKTARDPSPADGAQLIDPANLTLTWTPGFRAKLHTVYFGDDFDVVSNAAGGLPQGITSYKPSAVQSERVYYWRVDEFDSVATYKGDVWAFTTTGAAGNPQPANGATGVQMTAKLNWTPATNAASHQIYLGTDEGAVRNATAASPEYKGSKALGDNSLDPGTLAWHSTYYWRVDAVYNATPGNPVKGLVWSFTTADFLLVDDFESYNDIDPPNPASNRIFEAWIDGFASPTTNGALVGNELPPYAERTVVHGGAQSMPYSYDNNLKYSEATLTLVYPRDWTQNDVNTLTLWFRGNKNNAAERMYIALNGSAVVYNDNPKASQISIWTGWNTNLKAFADQGVNLTNVNSIAIGFGNKASPGAGGSGKMYFDDIRLATAAVPVGRILLLDEDFESLVLGPNVEEGTTGTEVWTETPPPGWVIDESGVPGVGNRATDGVTEWAGWAFTNKDWWVGVAGDQRRVEFTLGQGTIAVADPDEWDDAAHPPGYNVAANPYDTWLDTPPIDISGCTAGTVQLEFASSWRPEFDSDYHQTATITASFNGSEPVEVLRWESDAGSPNYKPDTSTNETITVNVDNPAWATSVVLTFGLFDAGNDWWWAIDNVKVSGLPK